MTPLFLKRSLKSSETPSRAREKGAFEEVASLLFEKFADEHGHHLDKDSIEKMAKLAAAELLLQVYIKFFEDVGALKEMA